MKERDGPRRPVRQATSQSSLLADRRVWWSLCLLLLAAALWARWDAAVVWYGDEVRVDDPDTLRRLVRLRALDQATTYPIVERYDGHPEGTVIHWTRPMDWVLRGLDPLARLVVPGAQRYEAGAILAGPLLALLSILVMLLGARRLLGPTAALFAGTAYAFADMFLDATWLGNGDHQSLQHLALVVATLLGLLTLAGTWSASAALGAGAALGFAVWVSTESMLAAYVHIAIVAGLAAFAADVEGKARRAAVAWSTGFASMLTVGHLLEQDGLWAFEYDKVSWFQLWQALVVLAFTLLLRWIQWPAWKRTAASALGALAAGLMPFALSSGLRAAWIGEWARLAKASAWLHNEIIEFRGLFVGLDYRFTLERALIIEGWALFALPLLLVAAAFLRGLPAAARGALIALAVTTFGLEVWEAKLGHLYAMVFPLVLGAAGSAAAQVPWLAARRWPALAAAAVAVVWFVVLPLPAPRSTQSLTLIHSQWRQACRALSEETARLQREGGRIGAVLAPWDMGAHILYCTGLPVVASNYHRNIDGILDAYRVLLAGPAEEAEVWRILRQRDVRWIVAWYDQLFLHDGQVTLGRPPMAQYERDGFTLLPAAQRTLYWVLREAPQVPGLTLRSEGEVGFIGQRREPLFRLWEVR